MLQPLFVYHDRKTEEDRDDDHPHRTAVLGKEVFERGHDAVARAAFDLRIAHHRVEAAGVEQLLRSGLHACAPVGLSELVRDLIGLVVQVAAAVRPSDVVHDQDRKDRAGRSGDLGEHLELVVDRVPVVVAVDQRDVHRRQLGQHTQAQVAVEEEAPGELLLGLGSVEGRRWIDGVELGVGSEEVEREGRGLAARVPRSPPSASVARHASTGAIAASQSGNICL